MHLSTLEARQLSQVFELLSQPQESVVLRRRLIAPLSSLLGADSITSTVWDEPTQRFVQGVSNASDAQMIDNYQSHHQFSDPLAPALRARRYPTLVTQVVAQRDLVASEFYGRFLQPGQMHWGLNLYAHDGHRDVGDFRVWRSRRRGNFDAHHLDMLNLIYPSLVHALSASRRVEPAPEHAGGAHLPEPRLQPTTRQQTPQQLAYQHGLSRRELQIAQLTAQGLSDKEIAKAAGIGFTTVRTYLSQALKKTGCSNRKELIAYVCSRAATHEPRSATL